METPRPLSLPQVGAVALGNALEFYDFLTFGFFAIQIGAVFFPTHNQTTGLLLSLATFGVGFLTRPLGGIVIGRMGDVRGRKPAMLLSFGLMGASITGLALTPSYAGIGIAAPLLMVFFRLVQGFALGGEVGPSTAFLLEAAPPARRGFYVSLQYATQLAATLAAGLVGLALANLLTPQALTAWGWRVAFLIGAAVVPFGLIVRQRLPETFVARGIGLPRLTGAELKLAGLGIMMLAAGTISVYTMNYMTTFGTRTLGLPPKIAFGATVVHGFLGMVLTPLCGLMSDRLGRKPVMLMAMGALMLAVIPCFMMMVAFRTPLALLGGTAVMAALNALGSSAMLVSVSESLPAHLRSSGIGIIYALAISIFGGSAQFVVTWLIQATGSPIAPGLYLTTALLLGLCAMLVVRETAPVRVGR